MCCLFPFVASLTVCVLKHFSHFNKHVLNPIQRGGYQGDGRRAMMKLKNEVLDKSLLRRTKQSRAEDMCLPPRVVTIRAIRLHPREEDFYNALYTQTKSSFDDYVQEGTLLNNYAHIFDLYVARLVGLAVLAAPSFTKLTHAFFHITGSQKCAKLWTIPILLSSRKRTTVALRSKIPQL
jgi:SNF2 family DNA or RNA helicase